MHCPECGEPLTAEDIVAVPGPGGRAARGTALVGSKLAREAEQPAR